ncbi:PAS domain-containing protein [Thalassobaculum sp. OXR-137]|uniref:PAS domain-containing protein n=1 Tax=Thalassobaculum sp. OXR-137 TaxID=3100173 RepID=UPI002AC9588A|nr:PAS domain-containing protein [Thalassobaculum sp. OXR-137]WPZ32523.1 PAS domain-containing protein [Thalassobaculum sp. OXR-137]
MDAITMAIDTSQLTRTELWQLLTLWRNGRHGRDIPAVGGLCPVDVAPFLGHIVIVEVEERTDRIRFLQMGRELTPVFGEDMVGRYLDQMPLALRGHVEESYRTMMAERAPQYAEFEVAGDSWMVIFERLMLPFCDPATDRVAGAMVAIYPRISIRKRATEADRAEESVAA